MTGLILWRKTGVNLSMRHLHISIGQRDVNLTEVRVEALDLAKVGVGPEENIGHRDQSQITHSNLHVIVVNKKVMCKETALWYKIGSSATIATSRNIYRETVLIYLGKSRA